MTTDASSPRREPARCPPRARGRTIRVPDAAPARLGLFATVLFIACCAMAISVLAAPAPAMAQGLAWAQATGPAAAPADAEAAIRATATRYAQAWFEGNAGAMAQVLHPEFRLVVIHRVPHAPDVAEPVGGLAFLDRVDRGFGRFAAAADRASDLQDLEIRDGLATARLAFAGRAESLQLVRWNNRWRVLQAVAEQQDKAP